jgi:hypothetical protein
VIEEMSDGVGGRPPCPVRSQPGGTRCWPPTAWPTRRVPVQQRRSRPCRPRWSGRSNRAAARIGARSAPDVRRRPVAHAAGEGAVHAPPALRRRCAAGGFCVVFPAPRSVQSRAAGKARRDGLRRPASRRNLRNPLAHRASERSCWDVLSNEQHYLAHGGRQRGPLEAHRRR